MRYLLLSLLLLFGTSAAAQEPAETSPDTYTAVISFSNLRTCPPCRSLDAKWKRQTIIDRARNLGVARFTVDGDTPGASKLFDSWQVRTIPTTVLVEVDRESFQAVRVYRRVVGDMQEQRLLQFIDKQSDFK